VRQYDSIGELIRALQKTYIINSKTKNDVAEMWVGLSQIRSLLPVQMSQEEEGLMRERLWYVVFHWPIRLMACFDTIIKLYTRDVSLP
jgi:ryanodine receptor 2